MRNPKFENLFSDFEFRTSNFKNIVWQKNQ
jgi:hypothetical protein